jgi:hypothetical protein
MLIARCATPINSPLIRLSLVSPEELARNQRREALHQNSCSVMFLHVRIS